MACNPTFVISSCTFYCIQDILSLLLWLIWSHSAWATSIRSVYNEDNRLLHYFNTLHWLFPSGSKQEAATSGFQHCSLPLITNYQFLNNKWNLPSRKLIVFFSYFLNSTFDFLYGSTFLSGSEEGKKPLKILQTTSVVTLYITIDQTWLTWCDQTINKHTI